jgi:hypothetical protein
MATHRVFLAVDHTIPTGWALMIRGRATSNSKLHLFAPFAQHACLRLRSVYPATNERLAQVESLSWNWTGPCIRLLSSIRPCHWQPNWDCTRHTRTHGDTSVAIRKLQWLSGVGLAALLPCFCDPCEWYNGKAITLSSWHGNILPRVMGTILISIHSAYEYSV